jgi:hypothetical protein
VTVAWDAPDDVEPGALVGGVRIEARIAGAMTNEIFRGRAPKPSLVQRWLGRRVPSGEVLVAVRPRLDEHDGLRAELGYELPGVAGAFELGEIKSPSLVRSALVEELPPGRPVSELAPMPEPRARTLLVELASVVQVAHARGAILCGIHPRLCFATDTGLGGLAPRALRFLMGSRLGRGGPCLRELYLPRSAWMQRFAPDATADVFATCALGVFLLTGEHPFAGETFEESIESLVSGRVPYVEGPLGHVLARGLAPTDRPTAAELRAALAAL